MISQEEKYYRIGRVSNLVYLINKSVTDAEAESSKEWVEENLRPLVKKFAGPLVKIDDSCLIPDSYRDLSSIIDLGKSLDDLHSIYIEITDLAYSLYEDDDDDDDDSEELGGFLDPDFEDYFETCMERD